MECCTIKSNSNFVKVSIMWKSLPANFTENPDSIVLIDSSLVLLEGWCVGRENSVSCLLLERLCWPTYIFQRGKELYSDLVFSVALDLFPVLHSTACYRTNEGEKLFHSFLVSHVHIFALSDKVLKAEKVSSNRLLDFFLSTPTGSSLGLAVQ